MAERKCYLLYKLMDGANPERDLTHYDVIVLTPRFVLVNWGGEPDEEVKRKYLMTFPIPPLVMADILSKAIIERYAITIAITGSIDWRGVTEMTLEKEGSTVTLKPDGTVCVTGNTKETNEILTTLGDSLEKHFKEALTIP